MQADAPDIRLRPATADDLPMLEGWIGRPHWQQWWGPPETEVARIRAMVEGRDSTRPFIFEIDGAPAGYAQCWFVADERDEDRLRAYPWLALLPDDGVGLDISIGDEAHLSRGIGSTVIGMLARRLWAQGRRAIHIDPHAGNARAIRAYEKAGFRVIEALRGRTGDMVLMRFHPSDPQ